VEKKDGPAGVFKQKPAVSLYKKLSVGPKFVVIIPEKRRFRESFKCHR